MSNLKITLAQINPLVGDIDGNTAKILAHVDRAISEQQADVVVFPELTLSGYPPEDLLLRPSLQKRIDRALAQLCAIPRQQCMIVGYPKRIHGQLFNMAGVIINGEIVLEYAKQCLPNYQVFDEKRYFAEGSEAGIFRYAEVTFGLSICEDIWDGSPITQLKDNDIDVVLNLNASPFHKHKQAERESLVTQRAQFLGAPIVYVNQVGGQDELVFDGGSFIADKSGFVAARLPLFDEQLQSYEFDRISQQFITNSDDLLLHPHDPIAVTYQALVLGVKDYVNKNGFRGIVLGLSGGIDSALTLAVAVDALGAERVEAVMMPFRYTSDMSKNDAQEEADILGVRYRSIDIEPMYDAFVNSLASAFEGTAKDKTEENIQARSRGVLLMALSNKLGYLVLTTGNKSEMSVGYATLYGDMAGGLDVLKDVPKIEVFALSRYRNTLGYVIPERVITRPPSAELAPDQKDEDSLPPYEILDEILEWYVEHDESADDIIARGFNADDVRRVLRMVDINEYKRRQAPIGIRLSRRAFGRDRRYPITNGWKIGD